MSRQERRQNKIVGVNDNEGPPVPIPNTEVKLVDVDNTWLETARDDRKRFLFYFFPVWGFALTEDRFIRYNSKEPKQ